MQSAFRPAPDADRQDRLAIKAALPAKLQGLLRWETIDRWLKAHEFGSVLGAQVFCGMKKTTLPARYQQQDQLLMQVRMQGDIPFFLFTKSIVVVYDHCHDPLPSECPPFLTRRLRDGPGCS